MDYLYKYFSDKSEYALQNLKDNRICFSSLETLNDPFEGVGSYTYSVSGEEKAYWESIGVNLPKMMSERLSDDVKKSANFYYRVFCSTEDNKNPLMWAYYANSHQGFCVGYAKDDIIKLSSDLRDIIYEDEMYPINNFNEYEDVLKNLLFRKSAVWQGEREQRAICRLTSEDIKCLPINELFEDHSNNKKIYLPYGSIQMGNLCALCSEKYILKECKAAAIYLGLRTPMCVRKEIKEFAIKNDIPVFQMIQQKNQYSLTYTRC